MQGNRGDASSGEAQTPRGPLPQVPGMRRAAQAPVQPQAGVAQTQSTQSPPSQQPRSGPTIPVEPLNMDVDINVDTISLSISQIANLQPDQIIKLNSRKHGLVNILVQGKKIAEGVLVDVEGELSVQLTSIAEISST